MQTAGEGPGRCPLHQRAQRLLKRCERQMDLGENACHAQDRNIPFEGSMPGKLEKRRFPDPRLTANNERRSTMIDALYEVLN